MTPPGLIRKPRRATPIADALRRYRAATYIAHIGSRAPTTIVWAAVVVADGARGVVVVFAADVAVPGRGDETHCARGGRQVVRGFGRLVRVRSQGGARLVGGLARLYSFPSVLRSPSSCAMSVLYARMKKLYEATSHRRRR